MSTQDWQLAMRQDVADMREELVRLRERVAVLEARRPPPGCPAAVLTPYPKLDPLPDPYLGTR